MRAPHAFQQLCLELFRLERRKCGVVAVICALLENEEVHDLFSIPARAIAHEFLNVCFCCVGEFHSHGCSFRTIVKQSTPHFRR
jgi:hypothetical protein